MAKGWRNEPLRHSLARKGVKTGRKGYVSVKRVNVKVKQSLANELGGKKIVNRYETAYSYGEGVELDNSEEYMVFDSYGNAEKEALARVREDMEESPEMFVQDWLNNFIDGERMADEFESDISNMRFEDVKDNPESYDLTQNDVEEETQAFTNKVEELTEQELNEIRNNPFEYLRGLGIEDKATDYINVDEAVQDAVDTDGVAHFLSSYDGEERILKSGKYAYRVN